MLKIFGRATSSNVQKVLWVCGEIGLDFEREDIGGPFGGNDKPEYLALNPNGRVPTIIDDGFVLWESNSITRYLAAKHAPGTLYPDNLQVRADGERWMDWQLTVCSPAMVPVFWGLVRTPPEKRDMAAINQARDKLAGAMAMLDAALKGRDFITGRNFTVGDIPVGIAAYRWYEMDIEREDYRNLKAWFDRLADRPAYQEHIMQGLE